MLKALYDLMEVLSNAETAKVEQVRYIWKSEFRSIQASLSTDAYYSLIRYNMFQRMIKEKAIYISKPEFEALSEENKGALSPFEELDLDEGGHKCLKIDRKKFKELSQGNPFEGQKIFLDGLKALLTDMKNPSNQTRGSEGLEKIMVKEYLFKLYEQMIEAQNGRGTLFDSETKHKRKKK